MASKLWKEITSASEVSVGNYIRTKWNDEPGWAASRVVNKALKRSKTVIVVEYDGFDDIQIDPTSQVVEKYIGSGNAVADANVDEVAVAGIDEEALAQRVMDMAERKFREAVQARVGYKGIEVKMGGKVVAKIEGRVHKSFDDVKDAVAAGFANIMLIGPAGSGKTTLAKQIAAAFKLPFAAQTLTAGASESVLIGRNIPSLTTGKEKYTPTKFVELYKSGGVFLGDEWDAMDANLQTLLNTALANGMLTLPSGEVVKRHKHFIMMAAANTFGAGATRMYVGRNQLDAASLDRFVGAMHFMDYDRDLERVLIGNVEGAEAALTRIWAMRERVASAKMRRVVGTRLVEAAGRWLASGKNVDEALRKCFVGWDRMELNQAGEPTLCSEGF